MPQWAVGEALDLIERERVTIFGGIPTHFVDCLDEIRRKPRDTSCLKSAWIGGAPVTPDVAEASFKELKLKSLMAVYGMTETTGATTFSDFDAPLEIVCDNKGKPIGDFEVKVCDASTGGALAPGEIGEVWVRGHIVMMGYYKNPTATAETITPEGWLRTGDIGVFDAHGNLSITGRLKDMFKVGGTNVYPAEIELHLSTLPGVTQSVVVGVPDERLSEVGYAFIQRDAGAALTPEDVRRHCKGHIADYKVPRHVRFVDKFPRTATGKIMRAELAAQARQDVAGKASAG